MPTVMPRPATAFLLLFLALDAAAEQVVCHVSYGDEGQLYVARPVASPYDVPAVAVGSHLRFRAIFQNKPKETAAIKLYAYAAEEDGAALIHQATYPYPLAKDGGGQSRYGFTGLLRAYEPVLGAELQYWCELQP